MKKVSSDTSIFDEVQLQDSTSPLEKQKQIFIVNLNSHEQSQHYLPNEIDDDLGASAISLDLASSVATRSF